MSATGVRQLLEAGVHFGHQTKRWNPKMKRFIFGRRSGIYIIDLEKTERQLKQARQFLEDLTAKGELVLFIGAKKQAKSIIEEQAERCQMPYVSTRWLGGTLTNFQTIKRNIDRLILLRKQKDEGYFERLTKKEAIRLERQLEKLQVHFSGLVKLNRLPACLFVVDTKREQNAVYEANRLGIPIVAICDTNADPDLIAHPIPGNDDAIRSIRLITTMLVESILAGRQRAGFGSVETTASAATPTAASAKTEEPAQAANVQPGTNGDLN